MDPGGGLITVINSRLPDDDFRQEIRRMHADQASLLDMVQALGLDGEMSLAVRSIVTSLGPEQVAGIRQATLDMLDRAENAMPVDCNLSQGQIDDGAAVAVAVVDEAGSQTIRVRASE